MYTLYKNVKQKEKKVIYLSDLLCAQSSLKSTDSIVLLKSNNTTLNSSIFILRVNLSEKKHF